MFSAIKSFAKRNRVLFILLIVAVSITLSYYISYDIPELISGIEKWYKLFSDLSIGGNNQFHILCVSGLYTET